MSVSVMLKPASSSCNLRCKYCFYSSVSSERAEYSKGFMSIETAENVASSALSLSKGTPVSFVFQGGEPTLRGLDFFRSFAEVCKRLNKNNTPVSFCLQTNGTLIDEKWCKFFKENNYLVGISLDGNREQNLYRVYPDGSESFDDVIRAVNLLREYNVRFNVLSVVTKKLALSVRDNYRFMKQNDIYNFQYINCLKYDNSDLADDMYMTEQDYQEFLLRCFRLYYNDNMRGVLVSIRSFDNYLNLLSGKPAEQCGMNGFCSPQFVVEADGTVYPCDFFCSDEYELGNINDKSFFEMSRGEGYKHFISSSYDIEDKCRKCDYFALCRGGGCKRYRADNDFCIAYKNFFSSSLAMMKNMLGR